MLKLYLDTCSLQRPLDSKTQMRIVLESEAVLSILSLCEMGDITLIASDVLAYEIERNPNPTRREYALEVLSKAAQWIVLNESIEARARVFNSRGIQPLDALHLASAEAAEARYFCTCDDKLLRRARSFSDLRVQVISPLDLVGEIV